MDAVTDGGRDLINVTRTPSMESEMEVEHAGSMAIMACALCSVAACIAFYVLYALFPRVRAAPGWQLSRSVFFELVASCAYVSIAQGFPEPLPLRSKYSTLWKLVIACDACTVLWRIWMYVDLVVCYHDPFSSTSHLGMYNLLTAAAFAGAYRWGDSATSASSTWSTFANELVYLPALAFISVGCALYFLLLLLLLEKHASRPFAHISQLSRQRAVTHAGLYLLLYASLQGALVALWVAIRKDVASEECSAIYVGMRAADGAAARAALGLDEPGADADGATAAACTRARLALVCFTSLRSALAFVGWVLINFCCGAAEGGADADGAPFGAPAHAPTTVPSRAFVQQLRYELAYQVLVSIGEAAQLAIRDPRADGARLELDTAEGLGCAPSAPAAAPSLPRASAGALDAHGEFRRGDRAPSALTASASGKSGRTEKSGARLPPVSLRRWSTRLRASMFTETSPDGTRHYARGLFEQIRADLGIDPSEYARTFPPATAFAEAAARERGGAAARGDEEEGGGGGAGPAGAPPALASRWRERLMESVSEGASGSFFYRLPPCGAGADSVDADGGAGASARGGADASARRSSGCGAGAPHGLGYLIKQVSRAEKDALLAYLLSRYAPHARRFRARTLVHYYGVHSVRLPWRFSRRIYFVVMRNHVPSEASDVFDLKGATVNRRVLTDSVLHGRGLGGARQASRHPRAHTCARTHSHAEASAEASERIEISVASTEGPLSDASAQRSVDGAAAAPPPSPGTAACSPGGGSSSLLLGISTASIKALLAEYSFGRRRTPSGRQPSSGASAARPSVSYAARRYGTLRDWEWIDTAQAVDLGPAERDELRATVAADVQLLGNGCRMLDYSLLVAIVSLPPGLRGEAKARELARLVRMGGRPGRFGQRVYFFGMIDCLSHWGRGWRLQGLALRALAWLSCEPRRYHGVTALEPTAYAERLLTFVDMLVLGYGALELAPPPPPPPSSASVSLGGFDDWLGPRAAAELSGSARDEQLRRQAARFERWSFLWARHVRGLLRDRIESERALLLRRIGELEAQLEQLSAARAPRPAAARHGSSPICTEPATPPDTAERSSDEDEHDGGGSQRFHDAWADSAVAAEEGGGAAELGVACDGAGSRGGCSAAAQRATAAATAVSSHAALARGESCSRQQQPCRPGDLASTAPANLSGSSSGARPSSRAMW